jgi:hypothetical protein
MKSIHLIILLIISIVAPGAPPAQAQSDERCFAEVSACISGPIRRYWERNGGLRTFGFPLTAQRLESAEDRTLQVQWFERDRIEIQADGTITAGRLGARFLEREGRPWQSFPSVAQAAPGCRFFPITGHQLCEPFLGYWLAQGGLERFGYPITERIDEVIEGRSYPVQYFERRRMEYHAELAGTPYAVLLGRLGAELVLTDSCVPLRERDEPTAAAYRDLLGCPGAAGRELVGNDRLGLRSTPYALQRFAGGAMLWVRQFSSDVPAPGEIFVLTPEEDGWHWQRFADTWREGMPTGVTGAPPAGSIAPERGFGYLWANNPEVRVQLGWAIERETGENGGYRRFQHGFLLYRPAADRYFIIADDGRAYDIARR